MEKIMEGLSEYVEEIARYFSTKHGGLISIRADGVTLVRHPGTEWKVLARKRDDVSIKQWTQGKMEFVDRLSAWKVGVESLPSLEKIGEWVADSVCETVTGEMVEPDGVGSDGAPSWLLALGMI
jgi:hypothetical protein